jgi:hypothetical protein
MSSWQAWLSKSSELIFLDSRHVWMKTENIKRRQAKTTWTLVKWKKSRWSWRWAFLNGWTQNYNRTALHKIMLPSKIKERKKKQHTRERKNAEWNVSQAWIFRRTDVCEFAKKNTACSMYIYTWKEGREKR